MVWYKKRKSCARPHQSELSKRLAKKIEADTGIRCKPDTFQRTYVGFWQKSEGAWVWTIRTEQDFVIGSSEPASECVKSRYVLVMSEDGEIYPERKENEA